MNRGGEVIAYRLLAEAGRLAKQGKLEQAAQAAMAHLRQHPNEAGGLALLGSIAMQLGALRQSEHFLRLALRHGRDDLTVARDLASVLNQQERLDEAREMFERLVDRSPDPILAGVLAQIYAKIGRHEDALAIQERLVAENPDKPHFRIALGHSLRAAGRVPEAIEAYRAAARIDYEFGEAWWGLASIKSKVLTEEDIAAMRKGLEVAIDVRNSAPLHFSLARALHDRGEYEQAFAHYSEGNRQRAESIGYDSRELSAEVAEFERSVDAEAIKRLDRGAVESPIPLFIVSLPRSGSTLLEQMLGSHSAIEPVGELPYVPAILRSAMELATRQGRITVPRLIASLSDAQADEFGRDYLQRAAHHRETERPYFIDKLPHNWSNILFIRRILPQARFIDIRRPAMDCCFSNFTQSFSSAHASSFALEDIGQCYVDYVRLMDHFDAVAPGLVHHVDYERLIGDAETELKGVLDHIGLEWEPAVLDFHKLDRVVRTPSSEQVRRPLNRDGIGSWRNYKQWLGPLEAALGDLAK